MHYSLSSLFTRNSYYFFIFLSQSTFHFFLLASLLSILPTSPFLLPKKQQHIFIATNFIIYVHCSWFVKDMIINHQSRQILTEKSLRGQNPHFTYRNPCSYSEPNFNWRSRSQYLFVYFEYIHFEHPVYAFYI